MPAAELSRLRMQINALIERFDQPAAFRIALRDLLELYSNRAYRAGQAAPPQTLLPSYRVPPLVLREIELQLSKTCQEAPGQALDIIDVLWRDEYLEPRQIAVILMGAIPISHSQGVLQKLREWALPTENFRMLEALFNHGTVRLRREAPDAMLHLIEEWLSNPRLEFQAMGLRAVIPLIEERSFENLPPIFRLIGPLVQHIPPKLQVDVQAVLDALAKRSPSETVYFLRQILSMSAGSSTARVVRRCLPLFSPAQQSSLRSALQTSMMQTGDST